MASAQSDETARLKAAEMDAERRYCEAMERRDYLTARDAANEWKSVSDALIEHITRSRAHYRDDAMEESDYIAARHAANEWKSTSDALIEYISNPRQQCRDDE